MALLSPPRFPELTTARLQLRQLNDDAAPKLRKLLSIPDVCRYTNWPEAPEPKEALGMVRHLAKLFPDGQGCAWMVEDQATADFIGCVRFNYFISPWKCAGLGYESDPRFWGQGLMTEAVRAVVACGHRHFGLNRIEAWTLEGNPGSDRVLEKNGFQFEGIQRQKGWFRESFHDFRIFARVRTDPVEV